MKHFVAGLSNITIMRYKNRNYVNYNHLNNYVNYLYNISLNHKFRAYIILNIYIKLYKFILYIVIYAIHRDSIDYLFSHTLSTFVFLCKNHRCSFAN